MLPPLTAHAPIHSTCSVEVWCIVQQDPISTRRCYEMLWVYQRPHLRSVIPPIGRWSTSRCSPYHSWTWTYHRYHHTCTTLCSTAEVCTVVHGHRLSVPHPGYPCKDSIHPWWWMYYQSEMSWQVYHPGTTTHGLLLTTQRHTTLDTAGAACIA